MRRRCKWEWGRAGTCQIGGDWRCYGYDVCPAYEPRTRRKEKDECKNDSTRCSVLRWASALGRWLWSLGLSSSRGSCGTRRTRTRLRCLFLLVCVLLFLAGNNIPPQNPTVPPQGPLERGAREGAGLLKRLYFWPCEKSNGWKPNASPRKCPNIGAVRGVAATGENHADCEPEIGRVEAL